ncbi:MAG: FAD-dependent oxidoreductase [Chromatiaceae bacterium]|nr:FAD-dependent oxidoreductase [Chromatiaceae bacterium]MCP5446028.1 FAD-dependent oxidoreductase [Chromatiaceae bacterium]
MFLTYQNPVYPYVKSPDQAVSAPVHHPLVIVGAGPVGMAAAIDAAVRGIGVLVLDEDNTVSVGSRAVCYSKRALEILDRLGCAQPMIAKGVTWKLGKIFFRDELVNQFDLQPAKGEKIPAFINLQQYHMEEIMVRRMAELDNLEVRWKNRVTEVVNGAEKVTLEVQTPDGPYRLSCDWLIVADGANSPIREQLGLESKGQWFQDRFLIADVVMKAEFPPVRWFSFDPSYHRGYSTLLHRQPDDIWRLDFQLGWDADPEEEKQPENVIPRVRAMLGEDTEFELEWCSVYTFRCRRMERFRYGRTLFVGDAAHQVSPFGARGANSGIQDSDNLIWKLKLVMDGLAPARLLDTYSDERVFAADENIMNSTRSTDFITPKSTVSRSFRDAVLELSRNLPFARALVNSGRLSDTAFLVESALNSVDDDSFQGDMVPGAVMADATVAGLRGERWLLDTAGNSFVLYLYLQDAAGLDRTVAEQLQLLASGQIPVASVVVSRQGAAPAELPTLHDAQGLFADRYDALPGTCYLIRPDQHVCARWRAFDLSRVSAALARATCNLRGERQVAETRE